MVGNRKGELDLCLGMNRPEEALSLGPGSKTGSPVVASSGCLEQEDCRKNIWAQLFVLD
ncbi:MAG: hypothetical protein HQK59_15500 [Deltaproteobacteria bacterium]|nr:hypothetical protein [Deltaproteobacteria bacterium]